MGITLIWCLALVLIKWVASKGDQDEVIQKLECHWADKQTEVFTAIKNRGFMLKFSF